MSAAVDPRAARGLADLTGGRPFKAHEAFEALWRDPVTPAAERPLWKGLAQLAAGWVHVQRGNARGAGRVLARAARTLSPCDGRPAAIDAAAAARDAAALAEALARGEGPPASAGPRVPRGVASTPPGTARWSR